MLGTRRLDRLALTTLLIILLGIAGCSLLPGANDLTAEGRAVKALRALAEETGTTDVTRITVTKEAAAIEVISDDGTEVETWQWTRGEIQHLELETRIHDDEKAFPVDQFDLTRLDTIFTKAQNAASSTEDPTVEIARDGAQDKVLLAVHVPEGEPDPVYFTQELEPVEVLDLQTAAGIDAALQELFADTETTEVERLGSRNDFVFVHVPDADHQAIGYDRAAQIPVRSMGPRNLPADPKYLFDATLVSPDVVVDVISRLDELVDSHDTELWSWSARRPKAGADPQLIFDITDPKRDGRTLVSTNLAGDLLDVRAK